MSCKTIYKNGDILQPSVLLDLHSQTAAPLEDAGPDAHAVQTHYMIAMPPIFRC